MKTFNVKYETDLFQVYGCWYRIKASSVAHRHQDCGPWLIFDVHDLISPFKSVDPIVFRGNVL